MISEAQYRARIAYLRDQIGTAVFPDDVYERIARLLNGMVRNIDDIETAFFDIDETRAQELATLLSSAHPAEGGKAVTLSLLDMFDLERISLLAERDPGAFGGGLRREDTKALTAALEAVHARAFPSAT